jgi:Bacterial protein of unknown function (DUF885)
MTNSKVGKIIAPLFLLFFAPSCQQKQPPANVEVSTTYPQLVELFQAWRQFHSPEVKDGVPDYSAASMKKQYAELKNWQDRLLAFDTTKWPIKNQVDWYLVWAEMNSLDFDHRVKQPWVRDPAFYVWFYPSPSDVPEREGANIFGAVDLPNYTQPLSEKDAAEIAAQLRKASNVFDQAKKNLTGNAKDLWVTGIRSIKGQSDDLASFAISIEKDHADLAAAARTAKDASDQFAEWLTQQAPSKTGLSGAGKENYTWYLKNVHLLPLTYEAEEILLERELYRSHSALRLMEHQNRKLPKLTKAGNAADYKKLLQQGVKDYLGFFDSEEILSMKPYMEPAMMAQIHEFVPTKELRGFFDEVDHRDPMPMRAHHYHWIDWARNREEPYESPIRQVPLLDNIFDSRAEGMATAMEELVMNMGMLEKRPRAKELVYIMLAQRAARGLGGLRQHGLEYNFDQATQFASKWVPWGLLPADGGTIQHEEQFYLQQPAYGSSYVMGKLLIDQLIAEYARQREGKFVIKDFMDEFNRVGIIPVSLIHWQMTGDKLMVERAVGRK